MKTNTTQNHHKKPLHLHVEHFFRRRTLLTIVLALLLVAILKADSRLLGTLRDATAEGYGLIGAYMREETVRTPITFAVVRTNPISGQ